MEQDMKGSFFFFCRGMGDPHMGPDNGIVVVFVVGLPVVCLWFDCRFDSQAGNEKWNDPDRANNHPTVLVSLTRIPKRFIPNTRNGHSVLSTSKRNGVRPPRKMGRVFLLGSLSSHKHRVTSRTDTPIWVARLSWVSFLELL